MSQGFEMKRREAFDPQSLIPRRVRGRWQVVNRSQSAVAYGHAALFVGFLAALVFLDWSTLRFVLAILMLFGLAVFFSWMGDKQQKMDAADLEKAIRVGAEIEDLAESSDRKNSNRSMDEQDPC